MVRWTMLAAILVALAAWLSVGAVLRHRIDDDMAFTPPEQTPGASLAVDTTAAMITRQAAARRRAVPDTDSAHGWQPRHRNPIQTKIHGRNG